MSPRPPTRPAPRQHAGADPGPTQTRARPRRAAPAGQRRHAPAGQRRFPLLVLGFGQSLLGDDGLGPQLATTVASWRLPGVTGMAAIQLLPEHATLLANAARVIFVDASADTLTRPVLQRVSPAPSDRGFDHAFSPAALLRLTRLAYGRAPVAQLLAVPAASFGLGQPFSPAAGLGATRALRLLRRAALA